MKFIAALLVILCSVISARAQVFASAERTTDLSYVSPLVIRSHQPVPYKVSRPPGLRMRNVGRTLTIIGVPMLIGGLIVYNNADLTYDYYSQTYSYSEQQQAALGVLMVMGGTGMSIPGIILWSKGSKKYKRHLEREAAFNYTGSGFSLSYRF